MGFQSWEELLASQFVVGTNFASFTTAKTVINPQALYTFPAGAMAIGKRYSITICGSLSNIVTTPGTITFEVKLGSVVAFTTGAIQMNATAHTNLPFCLDIDLTVRAVGSGTSANIMGQGRVTGLMFTRTAGQTDSAQSDIVIAVPTTAPAVGTGFDSTTAQILDFFTGLSVSNAGNNITIHQYNVFSKN